MDKIICYRFLRIGGLKCRETILRREQAIGDGNKCEIVHDVLELCHEYDDWIILN